MVSNSKSRSAPRPSRGENPDEQNFAGALEALGLAVRQLRTEQGLRQEDVAARAGLHESYISFIEKGTRSPNWTTILRICHAFAVPLVDFGRRVEMQASATSSCGRENGPPTGLSANETDAADFPDLVFAANTAPPGADEDEIFYTEDASKVRGLPSRSYVPAPEIQLEAACWCVNKSAPRLKD